MAYVLLGIAALGLLLLGALAFVRANPATLAQTLRRGAGISALLLAVLLALAGRFLFAVPLAWIALTLLSRGFGLPRGFPGSGRPSAGQTSRVRTATIEMTLDHDSGEMEGEVLAGAMAGQRLGSLDLETLLDLRRSCAGSDPRSVQLLDAYLDRTHGGWRARVGAEQGQAEGARAADTGGPMTREEAYEVLGVAPNATKEQIRSAHRQLMKKLHPDQGGSTYLASKVNEAKDLLLKSR
jgi:hypothetical protein